MASTDPRIGSQIGDYRIESVLGRGGMSVVYLAEHVRLKRKAALKLLSPELAEDQTFRHRFVSEWERLAGLDHPNIIPIFEAGDSGGLLYIAMRYVDTTDLKGLIREEGRLEPDRAFAIVSQTASALDAAHAKSLVHRDVKPANILVAVGAGPEGTDHVYLSDFGLTKHTESQSGLTKTGHFMGTIDYVAPEQIAGKGVDGRTDQYALGCVLYECLTGKVPFPREEDTASLFAHLQDPPPRATDIRPDLPPAIDDVIATAMAKDKEARYASCTDFARAVRMALQVAHTPSTGMPQVARSVQETMIASAPTAPATTPAEATPVAASEAGRGGRGRILAIAGGVVVLAVIAVIALTQLGGGGDGGGGGTSVTPSAGPSTPGPAIVRSLSDGFDDPAAGWETRPKRGVTRELTTEGTYLFTFTDAAPPDAFVTSLGGVGGVDGVRLSDVSVQVSATLVALGAEGDAHLFGVACRVNVDSTYYLVIGTDGHWEVDKVFDTTGFAVLDHGTDPRIANGEATYAIEGLCLGGRDGTPAALTLIVNGTSVGTVTDDDPILDGSAGLFVSGQPGLVVQLDDFTLEELALPSPSPSAAA